VKLRAVRWTSIAVGLAHGLFSNAAHAEPSTTSPAPKATEPSVAQRADAAFRRGVSLAAEGDLAAAITAFEAAQALSPHPVVLYNLAQAYSRAGRPVAAVEAARAYLSIGKDISPERRRQAEELLALNERRIGWVTIATSAPSSRVLIDGRDVETRSDGRVALASGPHAVVVMAPGYAPFVSAFDIQAGRTLALTPALERVAAPNPGEPRAPEVSAQRPAQEASRATDESTGSEVRPWALGLAIAGGVVLTAGVVTYVVNSSAFEDWRTRRSAWASTPPSAHNAGWSGAGRDLDAELDDLHGVDRVAVALGAAGVAAAASGLILYSTAHTFGESARLTVSPLGRYAALEGRF
jgi:hypothetical protein